MRTTFLRLSSLTALFLLVSYFVHAQSNSISLPAGAVIIGSSQLHTDMKGSFLSTAGEAITAKQFNDSVATARYEYLVHTGKNPIEFRLRLKSKMIFNFLGKPAPVAELKSFAGRSISLKGGKKRLKYINFWSLSCASCIAEFPLVDSLRTRFTDVEFLGIAYDPDEKVSDKLKNLKAPFIPIADGGKHMDGIRPIKYILTQ